MTARLRNVPCELSQNRLFGRALKFTDEIYQLFSKFQNFDVGADDMAKKEQVSARRNSYLYRVEAILQIRLQFFAHLRRVRGELRTFAPIQASDSELF